MKLVLMNLNGTIIIIVVLGIYIMNFSIHVEKMDFLMLNYIFLVVFFFSIFSKFSQKKNRYTNHRDYNVIGVLYNFQKFSFLSISY